MRVDVAEWEGVRTDMGGIIIFGGTAEGRWLAERLAAYQIPLHYFAATEYGASLPDVPPAVEVHAGRLTQEEMREAFSKLSPDICLDATHPYAVEVSKNLMSACRAAGLDYLRVLRREMAGAPFMEENIHFAASVEEAVDFLAGQEGRIFLTTGSRELAQFSRIPDYRERCVARVLPLLQVMEKCRSLGFEGKNLICMQGPFSEEMNFQMFREAGADWLVTKSSGAAGGFLEKCSAACRLHMGIVVIGRPAEPAAEAVEAGQVMELLAKRYGWPAPTHEKKRKLYLVAMGPGRKELLTVEAMEALRESEVLIGAERVLKIFPEYREKPCYFSTGREEILSFLRAHPEYRTAAACFSGDIGFYSGAKRLRQAVEQMEEHESVELVPVSGISSASYFLNLLGKNREQVTWMSCHGRQADPAACVGKGETVCLLLGDETDVSRICEELLRQGLSGTTVTVGSRLSYGEERVISGKPEEFAGKSFDRLSVLLLEPSGEGGR